MKTLVLRNKIHHTIGYLNIDASGIHVISDKNHRKIGTYSPRENRTRDRLGHTKGYGFLLPLLLGNDVLEDVGIDEMIEPTKPTTPAQRMSATSRANDKQKKITDKRAVE